jgi:choline dehydrogenase-like flavoprotein
MCAGAVHTPHLLQLSGIGNGDTLRHHDVEVRVELPGVGQNLQVRQPYAPLSPPSADLGGLSLFLATQPCLYASQTLFPHGWKSVSPSQPSNRLQNVALLGEFSP